MKYVLDVEAINSVLPAVSKENYDREYLNGVHVEDVDDKRIYTATNGHFLFQVTTERPSYDEKMDKEYIIVFSKPLDKHKITVDFEPVSDIAALIDENIAVKLVNQCYPDVSKVISKRTTPIARDYAVFNPDYLKKVNKFLNTEGRIPQMENNNSAAVWFDENKTAVLMPMRR